MTPQEWKTELEEFKSYFSTLDLPKDRIRIDASGTIGDLRQYIETNITVAESNVGNHWFIGSLQRLRELKAFLS